MQHTHCSFLYSLHIVLVSYSFFSLFPTMPVNHSSDKADEKIVSIICWLDPRYYTSIKTLGFPAIHTHHLLKRPIYENPQRRSIGSRISLSFTLPIHPSARRVPRVSPPALATTLKPIGGPRKNVPNMAASNSTVPLTDMATCSRSLAFHLQLGHGMGRRMLQRQNCPCRLILRNGH